MIDEFLTIYNSHGLRGGPIRPNASKLTGIYHNNNDNEA